MDRYIIPYRSDSNELFSCISHLPNCVWLDSGKPHSSLGRYDILSALPSKNLHCIKENLPELINSPLEQHKYLSDLPFCGGWIGFLSYDNKARFGWYDWAIIVDHQLKQSNLIFLPSCAKDLKIQIESCLNNRRSTSLDFDCQAFHCDQSKEKYLDSIQSIQEYLYAGDCYQVNYTQRFQSVFNGSSYGAYKNLRAAVPSPFSAYLKTDNGAILSISPERFIQLDDRLALTQPIKGTIARGANPKSDQQLKQTLQKSKKDLAENVMIVDLLRNDFSRHCEPFSVKVPKLFEVQSFANVHHLVSTVEGKLKPQVSHIDFLLSCFPGGSITGAPKKRAMEIIAELEPHPREVYCGAIGYLSCNGKSDFNIAIRTLEIKNEKIYAWAGGGIVLDSDPKNEYQESLDKISRLLQSIESPPIPENTDNSKNTAT